MMRIRSPETLGTLAIFVAGVASAQVTPVSPLVGTWEAVARSAGGLGAPLSFGGDNSPSYTVGAMVDFKYRRVRDSRFMIHPERHSTPSQIRIARATLHT